MKIKPIILLVICMVSLLLTAGIFLPQTQTEFVIDESTFPSCTAHSWEGGKASIEGGKLNYSVTDIAQLACEESAFADMTFDADVTHFVGNPAEASYGLSFGYIIQDAENFQYYELIISDGWASLWFTVWPSQDSILLTDWVELDDYQASEANHLKVVVAGDSIEAHVNDTLLGPVDAPYPTTGHVGFSMYNLGDISQEHQVIYENMRVIGAAVSLEDVAPGIVGPGFPSGETILSTNFSDLQDWYVLQQYEDLLTYKTEPRSEGLYVVVPEANDGTWIYQERYPSISNVRLETDVELVGGTNYTVISLLCRSSAEGEYAFMLDMGGYWAIGKWFASFSEYEVLASGASTAINTAKSSNHIVAECNGNELAMLINDIEVGRIQDYEFVSGEIGFGVETVDNPRSEVIFKEFKAVIP